MSKRGRLGQSRSVGISGPKLFPRGPTTQQDPYTTWGGQNGIVALPSRVDGIRGSGTIDRPGLNRPRGGFGKKQVFQAAVNRSNPRKNPLPVGWGVTWYHRFFYSNQRHGAIAYREGPGSRVVSTTNAFSGATVARTPIPHGRRHHTWTWRNMYDQRLWTVYWEPQKIGGFHQPWRRLAPPKPDRRSVYRPNPSFGMSTPPVN